MKQIRFELLDLNLLRVFDAVFEERSVISAGHRLNITPSGISHALGRLRLMFADELFIRKPSGMQPTQLAERIGPEIHRFLVQLRLALMPPEFDPAESTHRFTISCGPYLSAVFIPKLITRIHAEAPNVQLNVRWTGVDVIGELDSGRLDLALGAFASSPDRFDIEDLFQDRLVWAAASRTAPEGDRLSFEQLVAVPHVVGIPLDDGMVAADRTSLIQGLERHLPLHDSGRLEELLAQQGLQRRIMLTVPGSVAALSVAAETDMMALVPRRQAARVARGLDLRLFEAPEYLPNVQIRSMWHRGYGSQPQLVWLRDLVKSVAMAMPPIEPASLPREDGSSSVEQTAIASKLS